MKSQHTHLPTFQGTKVTPSGRLPSASISPEGYNLNGIPAAVKARRQISLIDE